MIWKIPEGGLTENIKSPLLTLEGHGRKVSITLFNPCAENILATSSADLTIKVWDTAVGKQVAEFAEFTDAIKSLCWSYAGDLIMTSCKDKKIRIFDPRKNLVANVISSNFKEFLGHAGVKGSKVINLGDSNYILSSGFSKSSEREVAVWDIRNASNPIKLETIDRGTATLIPTYDADTSMLYLTAQVLTKAFIKIF
jgi:coronin-1B/1C/6